jgi:DNA polymerase III subunit chi
VTEVAFHTGIADKLGYACRLLRKAYRQGARVVVRGDAADLARLDPLLWTFEQQEFIPHARLRAGDAADDALARTPIWLVDDGAVAPQAAVLVNLGPDPVDPVDGYQRVIEIVGDDEADRRAGHRRWREYKRQGRAPVLATPGAAGRPGAEPGESAA